MDAQTPDMKHATVAQHCASYSSPPPHWGNIYLDCAMLGQVVLG
jgi:hypothetical protein